MWEQKERRRVPWRTTPDAIIAAQNYRPAEDLLAN